MAVLTVVLQPPVNFRSANLLTNFWVLRSGIGDFSVSILSDDVDLFEPVESRLESLSFASSILNTMLSIDPLVFDESLELELVLLSIFLPADESWNFSFFLSVL